MPQKYEIRTVTNATFEGGQWARLLNEEGKLVGFQANGTSCTLYINSPERFDEVFPIRQNELVLLEGGLAVVPQGEEPMVDANRTEEDE